MQNLPAPILGEITAITIATPDLEESLQFYKKLGFYEVLRADWPFPWIQLSDGALLMMLRKDAKPYLALTYYVKDIDKVATGLAEKGIAFLQEPKKGDMLKRYLLLSPDGLNISLVNIVEGFTQPKGPGMLQMNPQDYFKPEKYVNKTAGLYGELAHPVADLEKSIAFWQLLGFTAVSKFTTPYPWAILTDGLAIVGLHQTRSFSYPAITYFAADMKDKIAKLKKSGIGDYSERGPGNIVLTTPEQQRINLFLLAGAPAAREKKLSDIIKTVLETERLLLTELTPGMLDELFTGYSDEQVMEFLGAKDQAELQTEKDKWQGGYTTYRTSFKSFLMTEKATGIVIGKCGYHNWYEIHSRAELGYALYDDAYKNKGYMTEALEVIIPYGFKEMKLSRMEAFVGPDNQPSLKIMRRFGFTKEGVLRSHFNKNGKMEDSVCFGLLHDEYKAKKKR